MKKILVFAIIVWSFFCLGASDKDNLVLTSDVTLTSTADSSAKWSIDAIVTTSSLDLRPKDFVWTPTAQAADVEKRYVSIYVIDQDDNIPLDKSILYEKERFFTDKTVDELRADIPLNSLIEKHNKYREGLKDKDGKTLKKVRLRDIQVVIKKW